MTKARTYVVGVGMTGEDRTCAVRHTRQLRGSACDRQVPDTKVTSQHNLGFGGVAVVTAYAHSDRFRTREIT